MSDLPASSPSSPALSATDPLPVDVRFRMRVRKGDTVALGPGKIALLEAIAEHGSISAAARSLNMSYRRAWMLVEEMNLSLKSPATASEHGGKAGGRSVVTPAGAALIQLYRDIEARAYAAAQDEIRTLADLFKP
ncbi:winged helix-turn-helix domain-containing protein [Pigmentiphaga litoralis]|uniref:Molybdate transport system regulatory protein n=1 Tax=Pigmentiphaga litoralis TaxID=516702 RepID=A0A7Y9IQT8_9BURK|nr:winged helix-turn-helix domain-containing protein [Pigmentiphaga litoralis]NYE25124.1 molybdate transport system regulatory protein [Pigmentiphaga litoralis]NYE81262.1 molybdate transport system regulatory protein [Pigmentiphaga litoralis]